MVALATPAVLTVKLALIAPAATVTVPGTVTEPLSLVRLTTAPLAGADPEIVTVAVAEFPPATLPGTIAKLDIVRGLTFSVAVCVPLNVAVIVAEVATFTGTLVAVKVATVKPPETVTVAGTATAGSLLARVTIAPAGGAGPLNVTVPVEDSPPETLVGFKEIDEITNGETFSEAVFIACPYVACMVTAVGPATETVSTVKLAVVPPVAMVTECGTVAAALSLDRVISAPGALAGFARVTVPLADSPPVTLLVFNDIEASDGGVTVSVPVCEEL